MGSLGIGYRRWESKKTNDEANRPTKTFDDIFSRLDTIHQRDRQTDRRTDGRTDGLTEGQTDTGRQQRPRLRIALRGKNEGPSRWQKC